MNYTFLRILILTGSVLVFNSCDKSVDQPTLEIYEPAALDENGGQWKPVVLASSDEVIVPAPQGVESSSYKTELQSLKDLKVTAEQQKTVDFWAVGGVYRWNEIARTLAANYNLPPVYDEIQKKYPVPDAANPKAEPKFPFCNPPYASRMFAYLGVAQYDALVAAWKYKYQYRRLAPSKVDASITATSPVSELPSYPSEDAVVAAASLEILKVMFPGEVDKLTAYYEAHRNSRLWGKTNVSSDLDAGEALGKAVAAKVIARAKADGMGAANNQSAVPTMITDAKARGLKTEWVSLDAPARPPMLPTFGNVKTWNFNEGQKVAMRPSPPPALGTTGFEKDLQELRDMGKSLTREQHRIASYWSDGVGSFTPPGHWNREAANLTRKYKENELRAARTMALVGTSLMDAGIACWDTKFYYYTPRPFQIDHAVRSTIGTPNFPSFTSGHSTFSGAAAIILAYLFPNEADALMVLANEASTSRIYGCIHYRSDSEVGLIHGKAIGEYAVKRAQSDGAGR